jgi:uncharacterized membrane protein YcaP (DUF421 family)
MGDAMSWLSASWPDLAIAAAKAVLMYLTALVGLRLGERRTMAQWTAIDFAAAVAMGAIIGRTAVARSEPFAVGAVALVAIIAIHRLASLGRFAPVIGALVDHPVRVLVVDGRVRRRQLRLSGLTDDDLYAALRQRGVFDVAELSYVLYEAKGGLAIVPRDQDTRAPLVQRAVEEAVGFDPGKQSHGRG